MSAEAPPRRTQRERRAATEAKLIDATVQSLVELGYARTSVKEICTRAGVSPGGLFGRFESRLDLIVAAAAEVGNRQIERFTRRYARAVGNEDRIERFVRLVCEATLDPMNAVWLELMCASRTDPELRQKLAPEARRYYGNAFSLFHGLDLAKDYERADLDHRILRLLRACDGEALASMVEPDASRNRAFLRDQIAVFRSL